MESYMGIDTNKKDWKYRLGAIRECNNTAAWAMAEFIDETPAAITGALLKEADPEGELPEEALYAALMAGISGIDGDDRELSDYFSRAVKCLDAAEYASNQYLTTINFPNATLGNWKFTHYHYRPYEAFIRDDIQVDEDTREIPQVGYFRERFTYPAVEQNGREWMAVKPSEIASMQPVIDVVSGNVLTFGLGLGYFAFMASEKQDVLHVDVVERDEDAIRLFTEHILPQFLNKHKVRVMKSDAYDFMAGMAGDSQDAYDYAFMDLWHDTADGLELYLKAKKSEAKLKRQGIGTTFLYWVERSLLSAWRWTRFDDIIATSQNEEEALTKLTDSALAKLAETYSSSAGIFPA